MMYPNMNVRVKIATLVFATSMKSSNPTTSSWAKDANVIDQMDIVITFITTLY